MGLKSRAWVSKETVENAFDLPALKRRAVEHWGWSKVGADGATKKWGESTCLPNDFNVLKFFLKMIASAEVVMCRIKTSINQMANYIEIIEIQDIGPQKITLSFKISSMANEFFQSLLHR